MELLTCAQAMSRHEGSVTSLTVARGAIYSSAVDGSIKVLRVCIIGASLLSSVCITE